MVGSRFAHRNWGPGPLSAAFAVLLLASGWTNAGAKGAPAGPPAPAAAASPSWADVDRLVSEQKYQEAVNEVAVLRERARKAGDDAGWAKALFRETRLRVGLGGYETAVRFLQDQAWPKDRLARAALLLY